MTINGNTGYIDVVFCIIYNSILKKIKNSIWYLLF